MRPWYGNKTNPPWYEPQPGVDIGWGPGRSFIFCFACQCWNIRDCDVKEWPPLVNCERCGREISTRRPAEEAA